ncbi:hypothetical protein [Rhodoflexus sp.]
MLRLLAIWCTLVVLNQSLNRVWIWVSFQINREYIAEYLCENKDKPQMACGGKCHLMKEMAAAERQDAEIPKLKNHFEVTFFSPLPVQCALVTEWVQVAVSRFNINYSEGFPNSYHAAVFHPPRFL